MSPLRAFALAKSKLRLYCLSLNGMYVAHTDWALLRISPHFSPYPSFDLTPRAHKEARPLAAASRLSRVAPSGTPIASRRAHPATTSPDASHHQATSGIAVSDNACGAKTLRFRSHDGTEVALELARCARSPVSTNHEFRIHFLRSVRKAAKPPKTNRED